MEGGRKLGSLILRMKRENDRVKRNKWTTMVPEVVIENDDNEVRLTTKTNALGPVANV